jgi:Ca2+:H+ antiporter
MDGSSGLVKLGPLPMDLQFWPGAAVMMLIATFTASLVTNSGRSVWFVGVLVLMGYLIFALTLYLLPPGHNDSILHYNVIDNPSYPHV